MLRSTLRPFVLGLIIGPPLAAWAIGGLFGLGAWGMLHNADAAWGLFWFSGFAVYLANVITWDALINKVIALQVVEAEPVKPTPPPGYQHFETVALNSTGTVGAFVRWSNKAQLGFVARMIEQGQNSLTKKIMVDNGPFTRSDWEAFRSEMHNHQFTDIARDGQHVLNLRGKQAILQLAHSPIAEYKLVAQGNG